MRPYCRVRAVEARRDRFASYQNEQVSLREVGDIRRYSKTKVSAVAFGSPAILYQSIQRWTLPRQACALEISRLYPKIPAVHALFGSIDRESLADRSLVPRINTVRLIPWSTAAVLAIELSASHISSIHRMGHARRFATRACARSRVCSICV